MGTSVSSIIVVTTPALGISPGAAIGLTISNVSTTSVTFSWSPPTSGSTPFSYQPQISANNGVTWTSVGGQTGLASVSVTGLSVNTAYLFRVITSNSTGSSTSAATGVTTLSVLPTAPTGLSVVGIPTQNAVNLQWNAPSAGTLPLTYQMLARSPTGTGAFAAVGNPTTSTTISITGLSTASSYDFIVTAANLAGTGPASSALVNVQTAGSIGSLPGPATGLAASAIGSASLTLTWAAPATGTPPFSYQPQQAAPSGTPVWANIGTPITATTVVVPGLSPNTAYIFQVVTTNTAGSSTSASAAATTASVVPDAPTGLLTSGSPTSNSVPLSWTAPVNGTPPFTYQVSLRTPTGSGAFAPAGPTTTSLSQTVSGLTSSAGYDFEVSATNAAGTGAQSTTLLNVSTAAAPGTAPTPATSLVVSAITTTSLTLTWVAPTSGDLPFSYQPQQSINSGASWTDIGSPISPATLAVFGLTPRTFYQFRVVTSNAAGSSTSTAVAAATLSVLPTAPTALSVVGSPTQTSINLQWAAPAVGSQPLTYQVNLRTPSGSGTFLPAAPPTNSLTQTITGLAPASTYDFVVTAANPAGTSANSATLVNVSTSTSTGVLPSAPTNLALTSLTSSTVGLSWSPPATGSTPFQYVVQYQVLPSAPVTGPAQVWTTTTFTTVTVDRLTLSLNQATVPDQFAVVYPFYGAPVLAGRVYWEIMITAPVNSPTSTTVGFGPLGGPSTGIGQIFQWALNGVISVDSGFANGTQTWATWSTGNVLCFAYDGTNGMLYGRVGAGGSWNGNPAANPATNVGGYPVASVASLAGASGIVPAGTMYLFNSTARAQFSSALLIGAPPVGYSPLVSG